MNIRKIQIQELLPALHLAAEVFAEDVAPAYTCLLYTSDAADE